MKYCFIDVETTGTDRIANNLFQISGLVTDGETSGYNLLDAFDFKFQPLPGRIDAGAMEKTGMTPEKLAALPMDANEAFEKFIAVLSKHCDRFKKTDKLQFVAYNANFDSEFIREFFLKMNDKYFGSWFWTPAICVMQNSAMNLAEHRSKLPNFQLSTLCYAAELGWDEDKAHDARYDIFKTYELFKHLNKQ
jgi:DNA polymerase III alpha subunit (gram-positive type)